MAADHSMNADLNMARGLSLSDGKAPRAHAVSPKRGVAVYHGGSPMDLAHDIMRAGHGASTGSSDTAEMSRQASAPFAASASTGVPRLHSRQMVLASATRRRHRPATATPRPAATRHARSAHSRGASGGGVDSAGRAARTASAACWQLPAAASIGETGGAGQSGTRANVLQLPSRTIGRKDAAAEGAHELGAGGGGGGRWWDTAERRLIAPSHSPLTRRFETRQTAGRGTA